MILHSLNNILFQECTIKVPFLSSQFLFKSAKCSTNKQTNKTRVNFQLSVLKLANNWKKEKKLLKCDQRVSSYMNNMTLLNNSMVALFMGFQMTSLCKTFKKISQARGFFFPWTFSIWRFITVLSTTFLRDSFQYLCGFLTLKKLCFMKVALKWLFSFTIRSNMLFVLFTLMNLVNMWFQVSFL